MATISFLIRNRSASLLSILTQKQPAFLHAQLKPYKNFYIFSIIKPPFSTSMPKFYSKASEAEDKRFYEGTPPDLELLADFCFAHKDPSTIVDMKSFKLSGFWTTQRTKVSDLMFTKPFNQTLEEFNHNSYVSGISSLISKFEQNDMGIPVLYPGVYGSIGRYGEVGLHTEIVSCYMLFSKFDLLPIAIRTEEKIVVINSGLFKEVKPGYSARIKKLGGDVRRVIEEEHDFSFFELHHSFERIILAIHVVAQGSNDSQMSLESAVSILALLVGYAAKSSSMKKFFEGLFLDPRSENYMPLNVVNFVKNWADYSKQIHGGCKVFLVDGEEIGFEEMFVLITLLNSKKENRREILEAPKKPHPMSKKDNQGVIISGAVDYFWGLLARWREVEEAVGDDSEEGVVAPEKPHLLKKENQGGLISAGVDFFWGLLARWREAEEAVGEGEDSEAVRDDSKKTS